MDELTRWKDRVRQPGVREWTAVIAFALAAFQLVLDFRIVNPVAIDWIFSFGSDTAQYYLAFAYYRNAAWHFPLTDMETMLHPVGASFMLADGLPLGAIPLKAINWALPRDFQFYGAWLLSSVVLSAVFAKVVLERLLKSRALIWAGIAVITLAPPFVARFAHCHLAAHWMLLASFWTVMEDRGLPKWRIWLLSAASLFVQPYLFVLVSGILTGAFFRHRRERIRLAAPAAIWLLLVALAAWVLGYFELRQSTSAYTDGLFADFFALFGAMGTSSVVPDLPAGEVYARVWNGKAEGFAYLGLGGILLFIALVTLLGAAIWPRRAAPPLHPTWLVLGLLSLAFALLAISPSPVVLGHKYEGIPPLMRALEPFFVRLRSAGRFIWPLFYYVLLFGLQAAEHWLARVHFRFAVPAGALLLLTAQAADVGPWLAKKGRTRALTHPERVPEIPPTLRARYSRATRFLVFDPPIERVYETPADPWRQRDPWRKREGYYPLALFGARRGLVTNTDFKATARLTQEQEAAVTRYATDLRGKPVPADVMLVTPEDVYGTLPAGSGSAGSTPPRRAAD